MAQGPYSEEIKSKVIELHVKEKMGLRAISKYFKGKPAKTSIQRILSEAGVYLGPQRMEEQKAASEKRKANIITSEREWRRKMAVCLWNLRKGIPVERTCYNEGWNTKSIWNHLRDRRSYRRLRENAFKPYGCARIQQKQVRVSRHYPKEKNFISAICKHLSCTGKEFEIEPIIPGSRLRADFLFDGQYIECKVDSTHGRLIHCVGQCAIYQSVGSSNPVVIIPDDVDFRDPFESVMKNMGVRLFHENEFVDWLKDRKKR